MPSSTIYLCTNCGEKCGGKYCRWCSTPAARAEVNRQNAEIIKARMDKGNGV